jgi:hypothetical protein
MGEAGQAWNASSGGSGPSVDRVKWGKRPSVDRQMSEGWGPPGGFPGPAGTAPRKQRHAPTPRVAAWIVARRRLSLQQDQVN